MFFMLVGCWLLEVVTGRLVECCVTSFHVSHTVPGALPVTSVNIIGSIISSILLRSKGKARRDGLLICRAVQ